LDLSRYEPLAGFAPSKKIASEPTNVYIGMETSATPPVAGIWEIATGNLIWAEEGTLTLAWNYAGTQLLAARELSAKAEDKQHYLFERHSWPQDYLISQCSVQLPFSAWPYDLWVAPSNTLAVMRWVDQGMSGWEAILLKNNGDVHLKGADFRLMSGEAIQCYPALSADERYAVSGYQTIYRTTDTGHQVPLTHGRYEVGRIVVIDIRNSNFREITIDDAVPAKLHGTASKWTDVPIFLDNQRFTIALPSGAKRIFDVTS
jgi:hypothetical protein